MEPFSLEDFLNRVRQADAWAQMRARQRNVSLENWGDKSMKNWSILLRSSELAPPQNLINPNYRVRSQSDVDKDFQKACQGVFKRRAELLDLHGPVFKGTPVEGRLLVYKPCDTLSEGASEVETNGFFDDEDCPPCDTWVHWDIDFPVEFYLFCWVPAPLVDLINKGIEVNSSDCIYWASELESPFTQTLRDAGLDGYISH